MAPFAPSSTGPRRPCPSCGYGVEMQAPICGNCGTVLAKGPGGIAPALVPTALPKGLIKFLVVLAVIVGAFLFFKDEAVEAWNEFTAAIENAENGGNDSGSSGDLPRIRSEPPSSGGNVIVAEPTRTKGYAHVRKLVHDLNRGGLRCGSTTVDHHDEYISTGSCQASGTHVQINIYLAKVSLKAAEQSFRGSPFTFVHKQNWFVITQPVVARDVRKILGGKFTRGG